MDIRIQEISKSFETGDGGRFTALSNISTVIEARTVTVFMGPSGSGKTTLLSLVGAMSRTTSGRIWIGETEITCLPENFMSDIRRQRFGFIFQNNHLIRGVTVLENVMLPAYPTQLPHHHLRTTAQELLEQVGLSSKLRQNVEKLSGGEQQRVAIARALVNDPDYLIADEPTAHLDRELADQFLATVSQLKSGGKTVLMASHDPVICEADIVDQVIALRNGQIVLES